MNNDEIIKSPNETPRKGLDIGSALGVGGPQVQAKVKKAEDFKGTMKRLLKYLKPHYPQLIAMILIAGVGAWFAVWAPDVMKKITNHLVESIQFFKDVDLGYVSNIVWTCVSLYVLNALFMFTSNMIGATTSQKVVRRLRNDLKEKLDRVPLSYYDQNTTGDIISRVTNDIEMVSVTIQESFVQIITAAMTVTGVFIMMLRLDLLLTLIALVSLPVLGLVSRAIVRKSQKEFANMQYYIGLLNGHIEEMYSGHRIIKLYNHERQSIEDYEKINEELRKATKKAQFLAGVILPALKFINNLSYVAICVFGGFRAGTGLVSIGDIQAFIQYTRQFAQPIENVSNIANTIQTAVAAAERVFKMFEIEEMTPDTQRTDVSNIRGEVVFKNVAFSYTPDKPLITNLNLHVNSGESIAIVGPTGAGKTTMVNLLMRFYEVNKGSITIDGKDIRDFHRDDLRSLYGMVLQDTWLFEGTVADNIAYGKPGATREEIIEAAKKAYAHNFIESMENGYDTVLSDDAGNISQGQKQLLTIARAILKNPKIIILDEATSSVDTRTEQYIQRAMLAMMEGRTSFVIAHRLSTIKSASVILVMNHGDVVEQGNHETLMAKKGFYYELYTSQFLGVQDDQDFENGMGFVQT
ncbi:MAG: ABC transporter ATP-binding protein [Christensenellales bacterium]|jgi:ATP-binding cassette subfamily B multidrug efflux pump|nr:ABC transporter ATP-binding protein [Clostridiales bacterium]